MACLGEPALTNEAERYRMRHSPKQLFCLNTGSLPGHAASYIAEHFVLRTLISDHGYRLRLVCNVPLAPFSLTLHTDWITMQHGREQESYPFSVPLNQAAGSAQVDVDINALKLAQ
jgi:hypothetical protein